MMHGKPGAGSQRGSAYVLVLTVGVTLGMGALALYMFSTARSRHSEVSIVKRRAKSLAEGATEMAAKQLMDAIAAYDYANVPIDPDNPLEVQFDLDGQAVTASIAPANVDQSTTYDDDGVQTIHQQYVVNATLTTAEGVQEEISTVYDITRTPLFQFAVFYGTDLEMQPGPPMTLTGRVHSNGDMYIGSNAEFVLDTTYVRAAGKMYRHRKDGSQGSMSGAVKVRNADTGGLVVWNKDDDSDEPDWFQTALDSWAGSVRSEEHSVSTLSTPQVASMEEGGYYYGEAESGGIVILDGAIYVDGSDVTAAANAIAGGAIVTSGTIADVREGDVLSTHDVDMQRMKAFIDGYFGTGSHPAKFNGMLWAGRNDVSVDEPNGIRFKKGDILPQAGASAVGGLTIVSDKPVYLWGDWNDGAYNSGPNPNNPSQDLSKKVPAAVIADAVNLLSNGWTNSKTLTGSLPVARDTNYYTAIVSGNTETVSGGGYNGGLENLPRFHENWSGKRATFRGSFVNLFESQYARGDWVYGGKHYMAPLRDWDYDSDFNDASKLPPFTPMAVGIDRVVWTSRR